jgi:hypothetical protein
MQHLIKGYPWVVKYILDFLNVVVSTEKTFPKRTLFVQFMHGIIFTTEVLPEKNCSLLVD